MFIEIVSLFQIEFLIICLFMLHSIFHCFRKKKENFLSKLYISLPVIRPGNNGAIWQSNCQKGFQFVERKRGYKKKRNVLKIDSFWSEPSLQNTWILFKSFKSFCQNVSARRFLPEGFSQKLSARFPSKGFHQKVSIKRFPSKGFHLKVSI
jgi:hypothetical protein